MSLHFDLVITCDLREDTPQDCVELIRWLFTLPSDPLNQPQGHCFDEEGRNFHEWFNYPFLAPFPEQEVISIFQKRYRYTRSAISGGGDVYRYALQFSARRILDDGFYEDNLNFVGWLATVAEDGFIGHYKEELATVPKLLYARDRNLIIE
ncbi:MAG: hypothetical protein ABI835_21940 [Chloroflexota bacterium]